MSERAGEDRFWSFQNPIIYGLIASSALALVYYFLATSRSCQKGVCQTNFQHFLAASPNEIGDTLAGIAGILAFLWIIVTVFLQSKELKEARKEYKKMAAAQQEQVKLLVQQGEIFSQEQREREQERTRRLVDEFLSGFCDLIRLFANGTPQWVVKEKNGNDRRHNFFSGFAGLPNDELLKKLAHLPPDISGSIAKLQNAGVQFQSGPSYDDFYDLCDRVLQAKLRMGELSLDQRQRLENLGISEIHNWLEGILKHPFWRNLPNGGRAKEVV